MPTPQPHGKAKARLAVADTEVACARARPSNPTVDTHGPPVTSAETPPATTLRAGDKVGRYLVVERLGHGGMGLVLAAYDPTLDRKVALKLLRTREAEPRRRARARQRMLREAQAMAKLSHPNVVTVHEAGIADDRLFIAMEYVEGCTVRQWCEEEPRSWRAILDVFVRAGRGLAAAHRADLVHRDFKPDNVLIDVDGRVRVTDFGLASTRSDTDSDLEMALGDSDTGSTPNDLPHRLTRSGELVGTPRYMAPEQHLRIGTGARADQYSFCVSLYEALYGQTAFAGETYPKLAQQVCSGAIREPPADRDVPAWVRQVVYRGMDRKRANRYPSMEALLAALQDDPSARRRRYYAVAAAVAGLLLAVGGVWGARAHVRAQIVATCAAEADAFDEIWSADRAERIAGAFGKSGVFYASDTWRRTQPHLDAYARAWKQARVDVCIETELKKTRSRETAARARACLDEQRAAIQGLAKQWDAPTDATIMRAAAAAHQLLDPHACTDERELARRTPSSDDPARRARGQALRERLAASRSLSLLGQYDRAHAGAQEALREAIELDHARLTFAARSELASALHSLGRYRAARDAFEKVFYQADSAGDDRAALDAAGALVYISGRDLSEYDESMRWYWLAKMKRDRLGLDSAHPSVAMSLYGAGMAHAAHGKYEEALAAHRQALAGRERALGPHHLRVTDSLVGLANAHYRLGQFDRALASYRRSLAIRERALGPDHPRVADALIGVGAVHDAAEELEPALAAYTRARENYERAVGHDHPNVSICLDNIGGVHRRLKRYPAALAAHRRSLAILKKSLGPNHRNLAWPLVGIGESLIEQGLHHEASAPLERALALRESGASEQTARVEYLLAQALWPSRSHRARGRKLATSALARLRERGVGTAIEQAAEIERWLAARR